MAVDPDVAAELLARKADIDMPSAEGAAGYPRDLLELSANDLRRLLGADNGSGTHNGNGNGNGMPAPTTSPDTA